MRIGLTMRMSRTEYPGGDIELRNAISCDWPIFLARTIREAQYVLLPNMGKDIIPYASGLGVDALIFTGGEDWGVFSARDETETELFAWAKNKHIPALGICRGAQIINIMLGGYLCACEGHVATRHEIIIHKKNAAAKYAAMVNSFHRNCITKNGLADGLDAFALAGNGSVEAYFSKNGKIGGIMWHPERESEEDNPGTYLVRSFLKGELHG